MKNKAAQASRTFFLDFFSVHNGYFYTRIFNSNGQLSHLFIVFEHVPEP